MAYAYYQYIYKVPAVKVGSFAPEIKGKNYTGDSVALSDFKGKYVLIDFWGSWCPPCRQERYKIAALSKKFTPKDFVIFSVGLETDENSWRYAIVKDNLQSNIHISSFKRMKEPAAITYGVHEIPNKVLLDRDGKILYVGQSVDEAIATLGDSMSK